MTQPLVTCITPTFGRHEFLKEMYYTWKRQDYENKELLILNDEPNVEIYCDDPQVRIINLAERMIGLGAKRNMLFENISPEAKYIMTFDDDDLFLPKHISSLVQGLEDNPQYHRSKNSKHYIAKDNEFKGINSNEKWPFFGASCFNAEKVKNLKFEELYNKGEDAQWLEFNEISTITINHSPTFIYRQGMNIVHASGHHSLKSDNIGHQKIIYEKIENIVKTYNTRIKTKLIECLLDVSMKLYEDVKSERG